MLVNTTNDNDKRKKPILVKKINKFIHFYCMQIDVM